MLYFFSKLRDNRIFQFTVVIIIILNAILIGATTYKLDPLFLNIAHLLDFNNFDLLRHDITFPLYLEVDEIYK